MCSSHTAHWSVLKLPIAVTFITFLVMHGGGEVFFGGAWEGAGWESLQISHVTEHNREL